MGIVNWRREGLFLAIAGMEACWIVAWSRVLLAQSESALTGLSWWGVLMLYVAALTTARILWRLERGRSAWLFGVLALLTSVLLLWLSLGHTPRLLSRPSDPSVFSELLILLVGLLAWFRAQRIPEHVGDMRSMARHFQVGVLIMVGALLVTLGIPAQITDLVIAYFGFGLLAIALTRIEEVTRTRSGGAAPFNLKWVATLVTTLVVAGVAVLLASQVITVGTVRWLLRPFATLLNVVLFLVVMLVTTLVVQLMRLLRWLLGDISVGKMEEVAQDLRELTSPVPQPEDVPETSLLSPQIQEALWVSFVVLVLLVALWLLVRSFRRWRMREYATPGAVRESVDAEATLAEDLADYLREQWRRLRELDLRRLFQRLGQEMGSVRAIYASLLALLAAADHPRQPEQTPYEFQPLAEEALPTREADIADITEAYVRARYGELEASPEELARLQEAWRRVRTDGQELLNL
jgi:hypothetical protein